MIEGPIGEGYSVYTTQVEYAGLSIAVISDRQFKSAPRPSVPDGNVVNGWFRNPEFDPKDADLPGLELLGSAQEQFLDQWALDWGRGARWKFLLSLPTLADLVVMASHIPNVADHFWPSNGGSIASRADVSVMLVR